MFGSKNMLTVRVQEKCEVAVDVVSLVLEPVAGGSLPSYSAGAHIDINLPNGMVRQYSLSKTDAGRGVYEVAILLDPHGRGGSECIHRDLRTGDTLTISHPRNLFPLLTAETSILFAGGIGITPILAMAEELHSQGRTLELYYCSRSPERAAYKEYLEKSEWAKCVHFLFDNENGQQKLDVKRILSGRDLSTHMYVCGPEGFIRFICNSAEESGWVNDRVHFEHFSASTAPTLENERFELVLANRGISIVVEPGVTPAQALLDNGIEIPLSCEQGVCGSCVLPVLDGVPDHRDVFLSSAERESNRCFTPCCSRSRTTKLVIDL